MGKCSSNTGGLTKFDAAIKFRTNTDQVQNDSPTSSERTPTSSEQAPTSSERTPTSSERIPTTEREFRTSTYKKQKSIQFEA